MKKIRWIIPLIGFMMIEVAANAQQTPLYSQYMFNMMNINPAYAGNRNAPNLTMLFRKQWLDIPGSPSTGTFTYDDRVDDRNYSWGAQLYYDQLGVEKSQGLQGFYSYSAPFERATLSLGMSFGLLNYSIDYTQTNPYDAGDPALQAVINKFLPTAGIGALLQGERWYVGISTPALLKTKVSSNGEAVIQRAGAEGHYFLNGGVVLPLSETVVIKPSFLVKYIKGSVLQTDINTNVWFNDVLGVGASYRKDNAWVGLLEMRVKNNYRIGYAYDYNISKLRPYLGATHEVMLRYEFGGGQEKRVVSPRYF